MADTLATIPLHATASIRAVGGDRAYRRRLMELGFLPGSVVRVLGVAPLGDPLDIELRGCRFSLRRAEAAAIAVSPAAAHAPGPRRSSPPSDAPPDGEEPADRAQAAK